MNCKGVPAREHIFIVNSQDNRFIENNLLLYVKSKGMYLNIRSNQYKSTEGNNMYNKIKHNKIMIIDLIMQQFHLSLK